MPEIKLAIDCEKEELLKEFFEKKEKEKEKERVDKLTKPKIIHSKTLVRTDETQKIIPIEDSKKVENDKLTSYLREQIKKLTKDNHNLKKQIEENTTIEETRRKKLEVEKQALLKCEKVLKEELDRSRMVCDSLRVQLLFYLATTALPPRIPIPTPPPPPPPTDRACRKRKHPGDSPPTSLAKR
ncbi:hypothetical protein LOD99_10379 [Oopsacas minuta]|uniref:Uncharacterized protein n=1 Tax=Oopsacas minuta TaxID=111878 RepID=A0AAV7KHK2_9METZ|nr:hypothetical protein LOD99_10379 [Oopsacas minuta]